MDNKPEKDVGVALIAVCISLIGITALCYGLHLIYPPLMWLCIGSGLTFFGLLGVHHYA